MLRAGESEDANMSETKPNTYEGPKDADKPLLIFMREHGATTIITEDTGRKVGQWWFKALTDEECEAYSVGFKAGVCDGIEKGKIEQSKLVAEALHLKLL